MTNIFQPQTERTPQMEAQFISRPSASSFPGLFSLFSWRLSWWDFIFCFEKGIPNRMP